MLTMFILVSIVFLYFSSNLLLSLLTLEIMSFIVLYYFVVYTSMALVSDFLVIALFSVFVMEGVIALSGLIILVSFSGSDYVSSFSFMKL